MRLLWLTDIHLSFVDNHILSTFLAEIIASNPDAILITGDIAEGPTFPTFLEIFADFPKVYFVLGNHDCYYTSIRDAKKSAENISKTFPNIVFLDTAKPIKLSERSSLIGSSSWADLGFGPITSIYNSLSDFHYVEELKGDFNDAVTHMRGIAQSAAKDLKNKLLLTQTSHVVVATHVPPWPVVSCYRGKQTQPELLPYYVSRTVGDELLKYASEHPNIHITVLCGHTHGETYAQIMPNLSCRVGGATYKYPKIQTIYEV